MTICDPACGTGGLPARRARVHLAQQPVPRPRPEAAPALRGAARLGDRRQHRAALRDEPAAARDRRRGRGQPDRRRRRAQGRPRRPLRDGADQSAVRQEVLDDDRQRGRRDRARGPRDRPRRLLGVDLEQAAQLRPARQDAARDRRPGRDRRARQRAVRGRRRRDRAAQAARTSATCTRCCGCRPASSTPRA